MEYHVNFLKEKSMPHGVILGVFNIELTKSYLVKIGSLVQSNNVKKVLTDARKSIIVIDEDKLVELSKSLNHLGFISELKRALLIREDVKLLSSGRI